MSEKKQTEPVTKKPGALGPHAWKQTRVGPGKHAWVCSGCKTEVAAVTPEMMRERCPEAKELDRRVYDGFAAYPKVAAALGIPHLYTEKMAITIREGEPVRVYLTTQITNRQLDDILDAVKNCEIVVARPPAVEIAEGIDDFHVTPVGEKKDGP